MFIHPYHLHFIIVKSVVHPFRYFWILEDTTLNLYAILNSSTQKNDVCLELSGKKEKFTEERNKTIIGKFSREEPNYHCQIQFRAPFPSTAFRGGFACVSAQWAGTPCIRLSVCLQPWRQRLALCPSLSFHEVLLISQSHQIFTYCEDKAATPTLLTGGAGNCPGPYFPGQEQWGLNSPQLESLKTNLSKFFQYNNFPFLLHTF